MSSAKKKEFYSAEVAGLMDLGRLACALERIPLPLVFVEVDGGVIGVQFNSFDSVPLFYYTKASQSGQFLAYRNIEGREEIRMVERMDNPAYVYAPVIYAAETPPGFSLEEANAKRRYGYAPIRLKDLASLAKLSAYQMIYNDMTIPLFAFPSRRTLVLGALTSGEDTESRYFYYVYLSQPLTAGFLKYDMHGGATAAFTNRMSEHGFLFFKIITLTQRHPLVILR